MQRAKHSLRHFGRFFVGRSTYKFAIREWTAVDLSSLAEVLASTRYLRSFEPLLLDRPRGTRLLVLAPHPDDEMIGPGGTIIKAIAAGAKVHVVYLTEHIGDRGALRRQDAQNARQNIGYTAEFLSLEPNALPVSDSVAALLGERMAAFSPDTIFVPFISDDHPDHQKTSQLLALAVRRGFFLSSAEVWAYQVYSAVLPNVVVDVTSVRDEKAAAIRMWTSAMKSRDWVHYALGLNAYNSRLLGRCTDARFVEAFFVVPLDDYVEFLESYG